MLFETIKWLDGIPQNLDYHQDRMDRAFREFFEMDLNPFRLEDILECPESLTSGLVKCRVDYHPGGFQSYYDDYRLKNVDLFLLVEDNEIDYSYKYADRTRFERLRAGIEPGAEIIIVKSGLITDTSYANLVFITREGHLITPDSPLLAGTKRQYYLDQKIISAATVCIKDLKHFTGVKMINAMMNLEDSDWIPTERLIGTG